MARRKKQVEAVVEAVEAPVVAIEVVEAPQVEAPQVEAPQVEAPQVEAPQVEAGEVEAVEDDEAPVRSRSVVRPLYRARYRPFQDRCGDDFSNELTNYLMVGVGEDGKPMIDRALLQRFAVANDVWVERYASLNTGMVRMNAANRLRAKIRKGHEVAWVA